MAANPIRSSFDHDCKVCPHVAIIILNYNSENDLRLCTEQVLLQLGIRLSVILVDNASRPESIASVRSWLSENHTDAVCGIEEDIQNWIRQNPENAGQPGKVYFVQNSMNNGYSAGNNIGIRLAYALKADAVLIANPDMRIEQPEYVAELHRHMFSDPSNYVVASRIIDLDGIDQNPLREATYWEELFWPRRLFRGFLKTKSYVMNCLHDRPITVEKVSGCCMMIRMDFLRSTGYLDENVFLYCEEPILSVRVHAAGGKILYLPWVSATHAHVPGEKEDSAKRMLLFIKSRKYYLRQYSGYNRLQTGCLFLSYDVLALYNRLKGLCKNLLQCGRRSYA